MKVPLISGAYEAKSIIANAQRCVNLYPEQNPQDSPFPTTHYETPGLVTVATSVQNGWRALYLASSGILFGVCGSDVYKISAALALTKIGNIASTSGPVVISDNTIDLVIADGTTTGYRVDAVTPTEVTPINSEAFYGADRVDYLDGFLVFNRPATNQFYVTPFMSLDFDGLDFASKTGASDNLVSLIATKRYLYLLGVRTTEVWYNTGSTDFTFGRMEGVFIEHGCIAKHSVARMDGQMFWLANDEQGRAIVMKTANFDGQRISTHAIESTLQRYATVSDAVGFCYQLDGHYFYVLQFPTADATWVYDMATGQWHEWVWLDPDNGQEHRARAACIVNAYGQTLAGDRDNGKLYRLDSNAHDDDGSPILRLRSFPHLVDDNNRVHYREFIADMEVGRGIDDAFTDPEVRLRWSDDKGASWGNAITGGMGAVGEYLRNIQFQRLGLARDRVFELSWSSPNRTALNGAYVQTVQGQQ